MSQCAEYQVRVPFRTRTRLSGSCCVLYDHDDKYTSTKLQPLLWSQSISWRSRSHTVVACPPGYEAPLPLDGSWKGRHSGNANVLTCGHSTSVRRRLDAWMYVHWISVARASEKRGLWSALTRGIEWRTPCTCCPGGRRCRCTAVGGAGPAAWDCTAPSWCSMPRVRLGARWIAGHRQQHGDYK